MCTGLETNIYLYTIFVCGMQFRLIQHYTVAHKFRPRSTGQITVTGYSVITFDVNKHISRVAQCLTCTKHCSERNNFASDWK